MNLEQWQKVKDVFYSALNKPESDRAAYLDEACSGEPAFKSEVERLLDGYKSNFLEDSAWPEEFDDVKTVSQFFSVGEEFSHYTIVKLLGRGGMGEVYLANDRTLDRPVAIKVVSENSGFGEMAEKRLLREAKAAARLDHPDICSVYEVGETDGRPFIAMQFVDGETLEERLRRGPISFDESLSITRHIAAALAEAHANGIVHRDIKPANIMIDNRGQVKVLDFGLAKRSLLAGSTDESMLSEVGMIAGTAAYMSPEQARGQETDARTDIWSLGVVFYQLTTGRMPFIGATNADTVSAILSKDFVDPGKIAPALPASVNLVVERSLKKERDKRYETILQLDADVALVAIDSAYKVEPNLSIGSTDRLRRFGASKPMFRGLYLAILIVVISLSLFGVYLYQYGIGDRTPDAFSTDNAGRLQLSKLFSSKKPPNGQLQDLSFSPDGKLIAFVRYDGGKSAIYIQQTTANEPIRITDGKWKDQTPVWSLDSQRLAYVSDREGQTAIWTISYLGGTPILQRRLEGDQTQYQLRKWGKDANQVYFESKSPARLRLIELDSGAIREIPLNDVDGKVEGAFGISADERMIAFVANKDNKEVLWIQPLGLDQRATRIGDGKYNNFSPTWFPDNKRIAYSSDQNGNPQIYVRDIAASEPRQITFGENNASGPVIGPRGDQIAYVSDIDEANVYSYDLKTNSESRITSDIDLQLFPSVSPTGTRIAYQKTTDVSGLCSSQLKIITTVSGDQTTLPAKGCGIRWSSTGREIAYFRADGEDRNLWKLDIDSQVESRLTSFGISEFGHNIAPYNFMLSAFDWSPDGTKIAVTSKNSGQHNIWSVSSDGTSPKQLTSYVPGSSAGSSPVWSPDSKHLAFLETNSTGPLAWSTENRVLVIEDNEVKHLTTTSGKTRLLGWTAMSDGVFAAVEKLDGIEFVCARYSGSFTSLGTFKGAQLNGLRKSPDGRWIAYSARIDGIDNVYLVSTTEGTTKKLTANDDNALFYSGLNWSPDAKLLLYSKQTGGMQISLISDLN